MGGLSPLQKFQRTRIERRKLTKPAEEFLRRRPQRVRVTTKGVVVAIGGVRLHFGHRDPRVWERQGRELVAYIDESDTSSILVWDEKAGTAFYLREDGLIGTDAESIREAGKLQAKARKRARQRFDDIDLAVAPTVDVAIDRKRKAAEHAAAAREPAEIPDPGTTIVYTGLEEALKAAQEQEQQVLQTGTDATVEVTLQDLDLGRPVTDDPGEDLWGCFRR